ncbi:capsular polysaccharide biosynthesis protein [Flavimaricola marinus]|uniref:Capsule polysaccharide biosynthesis protein n=1 Tax=Flavimaricola marinus TaxID=1819565 RepID=A0A238LIM6_9RHOB|nr:capsular polysaccharide biosynthesis protein [Flavimaricola marinus]SMY08720.1 Capsule polysaccharide biosynthesis protein [Flavimaricola marinus]
MDQNAAAGSSPRRLYVYNGGFLTQGRVRRILDLAGYDIRLGKPGPEDMVGVWGQSPTSPRGEAVAARTDSPILRVEDAFLRSVLPGRDGQPPLGLHLDKRGVHFDPAVRSDLEVILTEEPLDDTALLNRARAAIERLQSVHLSKYNAFDPATPAPDPGYVLVIDQTHGDASVKASTADRNTFLEMLFCAREENPGARILIKTHPETAMGHRKGYFRPEDLSEGVEFYADAISPYALLDGAVAVYTVSSQFGFEAILTGHKPVVFGQPFYMGWGLTDDRKPLDRRQRRLTKAQLFAAAMILYPRWYDPYRDRLCQLEDAIATLEAEARAWREDHLGWVGAGMRLWKRKPLQQVFGGYAPMRFAEGDAAIKAAKGKRLMVWSSKSTDALEAAGAVRIEDGFLRSRGLGADLIAPLSLVCDDLGIYYDPNRPSRLEHLIADACTLPETERRRAERLIRTLTSKGLTKYNLGGADLPPGLPAGRRILVPGQVEDDASIRLGAKEVTTNLGLLEAARAANPAAVILYKPHPDVEAGLRPGTVPNAGDIADAVLTHTDPVAALAAVDDVWTMTSALGFEALLRGKRVTCLGQPFYAGWGLTDDRAMPIPRRAADPDIVALAYATLIAYPRYHDPVTGRPCPVEVVVDRLLRGNIPAPGRLNRIVAKLQGAFASYAHLWR